MAKAKTTSPRALVIRRTAEGTRLSQIPDEHVFSARWIARELASGLVEVELRIKPDDGPVQKYELTGFEPILDDQSQPVLDDQGAPRLNFTGWQASRSAGPKGGERDG